MRQAQRFACQSFICSSRTTGSRSSKWHANNKEPARSPQCPHRGRNSPPSLPHKAMISSTQVEALRGTKKQASEGSPLWEKILEVYRKAEIIGALSKINSKASDLRDPSYDLKFVLQIAEQLRDKPKSVSAKKSSKERPPDVFESPDTDLTVEKEFTPTHMLCLNKFNVVPYHALTITQGFESQQAPLTLRDWEATLKCMQAYPQGCIAYFNSGEEAGASQPRKHLQLLPASLNGKATAPLTFREIIQAAFEEARVPQKEAVALRRLPFQSFAAVLPNQFSALDLHEACTNLHEARPPSSQNAAFNVLAAAGQVLLVPRSQESCGPISCNALVFAGTLLVRSEEELAFIKAKQPLELIKTVTVPWDS